ncbi:MAG: ATP-binding cassette domain-containing protein [Candidatus Omnitrophica bacterium]|nr:ATP-binding cassette domain-containing protein [Candidatus Omnitrophota bacterium]
MSKPMIEVENISKLYRLGEVKPRTLREAFGGWRPRGRSKDRGSSRPDTFWALKDVSFSVARGEVVGLIGKNGAGKSTLLKILSKITEPASGLAFLRGRVSSLLEVGTGFHPELTGRENIYLNGAVLGMRRREIGRKFDQIAAFAEVERFLDTPVKRYSSGMYVRLAFAVAAHLESEILFVDEVLAVGDSAFQKKCLGKIGEVVERGRTVLFVSHQLNQIRRLCHRTIWLEGGSLKQIGSTADVVGAYELAMSSFSNGSDDRKDPSTNNGFGRLAASFVGWQILEPSSGKPQVLSTEGPFAVKMAVRFNKPVRDGHHGIALWNGDGLLIWAWAVGGLSVGEGLHEFVYRFQGLPVRPGVYRWQASFYGGGKLLDMWYCLPELVVATEPRTHFRDEWTGVLNLPCDFCVERVTQ